MTRPASEIVARSYRQVLRRAPDPEGLAAYVPRVERRRLGPRRLGAWLRGSWEYEHVVEPLVGAVTRAHERILLRTPEREEVDRVVARVRGRFADDRALAGVLRRGAVAPHLDLRPLKLEMDVTTQCNLRCVQCYFSEPRFGQRPRVDIDLLDFEHIAEQILPWCNKASLSLATEPLLHPRFDELLAIASRQRVPWLFVNTNGQLLDAPRIEAIVHSGLKGVAVSIDAATPQTYARIRRGGRLEPLIANLEALREAKRKAGTPFPVVTFNFVMMRDNVHELPLLVELAQRLGVRGIAAQHLVPFEGTGMADQTLDRHQELSDRALLTARDKAAELGVPFSGPQPFGEEARAGAAAREVTARWADLELGDGSPWGALSLSRAHHRGGTALASPAPRPGGGPLVETPWEAFGLAVDEHTPRGACPFPWHFVAIDCYGNVLPCGWWFREPAMGNVLATPFEELWNGEAWRRLREEHRSARLRSACGRCPAAGMGRVGSQEAFGERLLGDDPD